MPQLHNVVVMHYKFQDVKSESKGAKNSASNHAKDGQKHQHKLVNHTAVQSIHNFERDTRNGKHYIAAAQH